MIQAPLLLIDPADIAAERAEAEAQRHGDSIDNHTMAKNAPLVALVGALVRCAARRRA